MVDIYHDPFERPEMHHEMPLDYMKYTGAPYLGALQSKLKTHIEDDRRHITEEERDTWNRKADKISLYELETRIATKADKKEIPTLLSELKNDVPYLTADTLNGRLADLNYIDIATLNAKLNGYIKTDALTPYATKEYVTSQGYIKNVDLSDYAKKSDLVTDYIRTKGFLGTINGKQMYQGDSINIETGGSNGGGLTPNDFTYTPEVTSSTLNSYRIGTLSVGGKTFTFWGKDNVASSGSGSSDDPIIPVPTPSDYSDTIKISESDFLILLNAGSLRSNTLYIVVDSEGNILYMWMDGSHIYIAQNDSEEISAEKITRSQWDNLTNKDLNKIYVVTDNSGSMVVGLGVSGVLTTIPVPANETIVRLTQASYNALVGNAAIDEGTMYFIVSDAENPNSPVLKIYLGRQEIPFGGDVDSTVIKSLLTQMFSEKITWDGDKVNSINWSIIDVDDPYKFYLATGFSDYVKKTIREAGFISGTDNTQSFAEMFATQVANDASIVKKASVIASINSSGESNIKIAADKINVDGVFSAKVTDGKTASQILNEVGLISNRVSTVEKDYVRTTNINQTDNTIDLEAVYTKNGSSKTASIKLNVDPDTDSVKISADNIDLNGDVIIRNINNSNSTIRTDVVVGNPDGVAAGLFSDEFRQDSFLYTQDSNGDTNTIIGTTRSLRQLDNINVITADGSFRFGTSVQNPNGAFNYDASTDTSQLNKVDIADSHFRGVNIDSGTVKKMRLPAEAGVSGTYNTGLYIDYSGNQYTVFVDPDGFLRANIS